MSEANLKPGDRVIYHDRDFIRWGPWEVEDVLGDRATVVIEKRVTYSVKTSLLEKVALAEEPA